LIACLEARQRGEPAPIEVIIVDRLEPVRGTNIALS
jgi:hypothetical protein